MVLQPHHKVLGQHSVIIHTHVHACQEGHRNVLVIRLQAIQLQPTISDRISSGKQPRAQNILGIQEHTVLRSGQQDQMHKIPFMGIL